jgi:hypothetical protein
MRDFMTKQAGGVRTRSLIVAVVAILMVVVMAVAALAITKRVRATSDRR